jgi:hypothetical protein
MKRTSRSLSWLLAAVFILTLSTARGSQTTAADPAKRISATSKAVRDKINLKSADGCRHIYGFNYQPSWGYNGVTVWGEKFDAEKYRHELALGKKYFPAFNAVRVWLSWSAYRANPERFIRDFQQAVDICGELDLLVVPVIFNRWIGNPLWDRVEKREITANFDVTFAPFIRALVMPRRGDLRVLSWDLCNEPFSPGEDDKMVPVSQEVETQWLCEIHKALKQCDPDALTCIGTLPVVEHVRRCGHLQDILTPHLYVPLFSIPPKSIPAKLEDTVVPFSVIGGSVELAKKLGKPIMSTECCWGAEDDAERGSIVRTNLQALKRAEIGFFAHALYTSGVADLHKYKDGLYMPFILSDGTLRPGHDVYNEFAR